MSYTKQEWDKLIKQLFKSAPFWASSLFREEEGRAVGIPRWVPACGTRLDAGSLQGSVP